MFTALAGRSKQIAGSSVCQEFRAQLFNHASPSYVQIRTATKRGGGSTKNGRDSAGRRLGVKKFAGEYVIPGNIIVRQRGRTFNPGQAVHIGRDHTLVATEPGWVVFYEHHLPFPHQAPPKLQPPVALDISKPGKIDDGSKPVRPILEDREFAPVKFPRDMKRFVGIVRDREDVLPRDQREEGRERRFWMTDKGSSEPAWRRLL